MNYRSYLAFILLFFSPYALNAQITQDIIRPSVNAEQFSLGVKAEAALSKGQVSMNIPLFELQGKGYDLPVSVVFYSGDVNFRTEASSIGLGWALMVGGVITRTIKGADDTTNSSNEHFVNGNYISGHNSNSSMISNILIDPMPDEYTYSLPGHSGTIDVSVHNGTVNRKLYPDESYKIEAFDNDRGFCIVADDGTKFYYEDKEERTVWEVSKSTSWFLTRIETVIGGEFTFSYEDEEYVDFSTEKGIGYYEIYKTKRIDLIRSDFGRIKFYSDSRYDRGSLSTTSINASKKSKRITKIELMDEVGHVVKGYELDNSDYFTHTFAPSTTFWTDRRHKLSSITQYDAAGNKLPSYKFVYASQFGKSRLAEGAPGGYYSDEVALDSWTSGIADQAYVDLDCSGNPLCDMMSPNLPGEQPDRGLLCRRESFSHTASDYFCLDSVYYPTGVVEIFKYEKHNFSKINWTTVEQSHYNPDLTISIIGRRLKTKIRKGSEFEQRTEYVYSLHDSDYRASGISSGVLTNPSIHCATYYTPQPYGNYFHYIASRLFSKKSFNSFMGPPVCYTEVEEIEMDYYGDTISRAIHYFAPTIVSPPVNYILVYPNNNYYSSTMVEIENIIVGKKSGYSGNMADFNNNDMTYIAYPVGEFYNVGPNSEHPLKDVLIGQDGNVRSVREYSYSYSPDENYSKFGYRIEREDITDSYPNNYTIYRVSKSEYMTNRWRLYDINTTRYYHHGNTCDTVCEVYRTRYNKGRIRYTSYSRGQDIKATEYFFPGDILNIVGNNASPEISAVSQLIEKNIIADPIKTIIDRNGIIIGGECKDYQMVGDMPKLKSIFRIKNSVNNMDSAPTINGNAIDYLADLYKEGEILTFDEDLNPQHVRINETQDRIYVWGYGGRFPVAVIDNMDYATYNSLTNLKNSIASLSFVRGIESTSECSNLMYKNRQIRQALPASAHITTYTYDPYFGVTSEMDSSNLGIIYKYDSFGRLSAKYDENYNILEEYNYNLYLQQ